MDILDKDGRPIWRDGKPVMQEIAGIERDLNRVFYGKVLRNEDDTLLSRGGAKGLKIYDELKRDAHAGAVLGKRKLAVTSRPWTVEPASDKRIDKKAADVVRAALEHLRFNSICKRLLEATLKGFAVSEVMWEVRDGLVLPANVIARDQRRFAFGIDGSLRLRTPQNMIEGEELPSRKFIVHRRGADDDSPYGTGVGGMLFWPVFFKRNGITFWLTFADKFGSPTALGRYPNGAQEGEQKTLLNALKAISQDAGIIVPEGMQIDLLEAARSGSVDTYEKLVRYMDEQMSKAVLGETMSTTAASTGLGSNQAGVQNDVRLEVAKDDSDELCETLNDTLVRWIVEFNLAGAGLPRVCRSFEEPEDLAKRAQRDKTLSDMGWEPSEAYMLETYGEGWTRKAPPPAPPTMPGQFEGAANPAQTTAAGTVNKAGDATEEEDPQFAEGTPLRKQRDHHAQAQAALEQAAEGLAGQWPVLMRKPVENLLSVLDETGDLQQFRDGLAKLLTVEPDAKAVDTIARATFAASVVGRGPAEKRPGLFSRLAKAVRGG
jgi:phage gp29-like protein